ncbi:TonB-dependent receptor plug domain-containing protein [Asticcacaulis sp. BYS171W]|uniref:TonB-dependent receptor plug domain-containing protein n=1 Tax=Asticcacaulis aquaticus TaxID=2984212 RepID=A0ABT5HUR2_9CAUL|nr:TonB-dependent receptor plug domain-containing protein [Asticcacaulis aquaticus]MDC7683774.1 TonB-dependent receptor plug domain-containing protein [Asticcacaulis aquaticus]
MRATYGLMVFIGLATSSNGWAQASDPPPVAEAKVDDKPAEKVEEVTVTASKNSGTRIDRRVYDVKTDPQASTGLLTDVLAKVPSVTVTADDKVYLRGDAGVTIWVDGKAPPEGRQVLRTLPASEIERIEVITNPSAQYAAGTSKGIINIITKKPRGAVKRRGSLTARIDALGGYSGGLNFDDGKGPWSWGFGLSATKQYSDMAYETLREGVGAAQASGYLAQTGRSDVRNQSKSMNIRLGYKLGRAVR